MTPQTKVVLFLILVTASPAIGSSGHIGNSRCSYDWPPHGNRCFKYFSTRMTWASAEEHCQNFGGHLVSMHSESEYGMVKSLILAQDPKENPTWIGLSGCQQRNSWFWSDGTHVVFNKWNKREPNHLFRECCVHMNFGRQKDWNDIPCKKKYPFVCAITLS